MMALAVGVPVSRVMARAATAAAAAPHAAGTVKAVSATG